MEKIENEPDQEEVKLFVHGLHPRTSIEDLKQTFKRYCQIFNITFKRHPVTGKHKGFAFFSTPNKKSADAILSRGHTLLGRTVYCQLKTDNPSHEEKSKKRLFIGGIPAGVKDKDLKGLFQRFGKVRTAYTIFDYQGRSKFFGYVDFEDEETAKLVLNQGPIKIKGRVLDIKKFEPKNDKKRKSAKNDNNREKKGKNLVTDKVKLKPKKWKEKSEELKSTNLSGIFGPIGSQVPNLEEQMADFSLSQEADFQFCTENTRKEIMLVSKIIPSSQRNYRFNEKKAGDTSQHL